VSPRLSPPAARTLGAVLERNALEIGERPFLVDGDGALSWAEMWERSREIAGGLYELGVRQGDRVIIALRNRRAFIETWFASALLGAIEVPVAPSCGERRGRQILANAQARVAVVEPELAGPIAEWSSDALCIVVVGAPVDDRAAASPVLRYSTLAAHLPRLPSVRADDPVAVMYTSGSTGTPKGAVLPQGQHFTNGGQAAHAARMQTDDVIFLCLPLHHNMAQGYAIWPALVTGASVRLVDGFDRAAFWRQVADSHATVLPFVGDLLALLAKTEPAPEEAGNPLRVGYGVPIPSSLHAQLEQRFAMELIHAYGSTEATIPVWSTGPDRAIGAAGTVVDGFDVEIRDPADAAMPIGAVGEICIRAHAPNLMFKGYYRDPDRTAQVLRDGWFHTGDEGYFDEGSRLWFRGRRGDVIRHHGEFVTAAEVEGAAGEHPQVLLAAAFGVASELADEDIMLAVAVVPGATLTAVDLREWMAARLPPFAVPRYIDLRPSLPLTDTGKIRKFELRAEGRTPSTDDARSPKGSS
jgi:carnitine-CoA ligase